MFRRISAAGFFALMALVIAFQHPVLGYCGCSDHFFLADCECAPAEVEKPCSCCQELCHIEDEDHDEPCNDCCQKISCDLDDLIWSSPTDPAPPTVINEISREYLAHLTFTPALDFQGVRLRPRPPPDGTAIYIRLGVMRL